MFLALFGFVATQELLIGKDNGNFLAVKPDPDRVDRFYLCREEAACSTTWKSHF
jgi:hypothetical protein